MLLTNWSGKLNDSQLRRKSIATTGRKCAYVLDTHTPTVSVSGCHVVGWCVYGLDWVHLRGNVRSELVERFTQHCVETVRLCVSPPRYCSNLVRLLLVRVYVHACTQVIVYVCARVHACEHACVCIWAYVCVC